MRKMWKWLREPRDKGEASSPGIILALGFLMLIAIISPFIFVIFGMTARQQLENDGYVVLAAGEYNTIITALNDAKAAALAANNAAVIAANTSENILDKLLLFNESEANLFPDSILRNVTLTAGTPADNFSAWTEVTDNTGVAFTTIFAATSGYIREVTLYEYSMGDQLSILELGYGPDAATVTTITRLFVRSDFTWQLTANSVAVPAAQKVYYRFKSETAGETFRACFKYILT